MKYVSYKKDSFSFLNTLLFKTTIIITFFFIVTKGLQSKLKFINNDISQKQANQQDLHFKFRNKISTKIKYQSMHQTSKFSSDYLFLFTQQYYNFFTILDGHSYKPIQNIFVNCSQIRNAQFSQNHQFLVHLCYVQQPQPQQFLYVYGFIKQKKQFTQKPIDVYFCNDCADSNNTYYYLHFYNNTRLYVSYFYYGRIIIFDVIQTYNSSQNYQKKYFTKNQEEIYYNSTQQLKQSTFVLSISDIKQSQTIIISGQQNQVKKMKTFSIVDNHKLVNQTYPQSQFFQVVKSIKQNFFVSQGYQGKLIFWNSTNLQFNQLYNSPLYPSHITLGISQNSKYIFGLNIEERIALLWKKDNKSFQLIDQKNIVNIDGYYNYFFNSQQALLVMPCNPSDEQLTLQFYSFCQSHQFYDSLNDKCSLCHQNCEQCFGSSQNNCTICKQKSISSIFTDYKCTPCKKIIYGCSICEIYGQCIQCQYSWSLNVDFKICQCVQRNRYFNNETEQCQCIQRFVQINQTCTKCQNHGCLQCLPVNIQKCIKCDFQNGWIQTLNSSCQCNQSYFDNGIDYKCQSCKIGCQRCSKLQSCQNCYPQFHKQGTATLNQCKCNDKFSYTSGKSCKKCISPCLQCLNQTSCLSCADGYLIDISDNSCKSQTPLYIYVLAGVGLIIVLGIIIVIFKKILKRKNKDQSKDSLLSEQEKNKYDSKKQIKQSIQKSNPSQIKSNRESTQKNFDKPQVKTSQKKLQQFYGVKFNAKIPIESSDFTKNNLKNLFKQFDKEVAKIQVPIKKDTKNVINNIVQNSNILYTNLAESEEQQQQDDLI